MEEGSRLREAHPSMLRPRASRNDVFLLDFARGFVLDSEHYVSRFLPSQRCAVPPHAGPDPVLYKSEPSSGFGHADTWARHAPGLGGHHGRKWGGENDAGACLSRPRRATTAHHAGTLAGTPLFHGDPGPAGSPFRGTCDDRRSRGAAEPP